MTKKHNARNERIKRRYFEFLKHARQQSEQSIDKAAAAIERFDAWNRRKEFRQFHIEQPIAFKEPHGGIGSAKPIRRLGVSEDILLRLHI